ncbi:hypothetical protein EJ04DRAFT_513004 [Polyplosphaeria fusca]|uniref:Uncharacterized protein n=1 Tax=Polyplosphaeria fusca TaxID=682080 RepID=A0A9P4QYY6_9PLEO|nr:hypothetical protein EJ04DRAFT_513004 [Polyplosphaeria fusca]
MYELGHTPGPGTTRLIHSHPLPRTEDRAGLQWPPRSADQDILGYTVRRRQYTHSTSRGRLSSNITIPGARELHPDDAEYGLVRGGLRHRVPRELGMEPEMQAVSIELHSHVPLLLCLWVRDDD